MSLTPHCDAAESSVAQVREFRKGQATGDPLKEIAHRMDTEVCEAVLLGAADLMDRGASAGRVGDHVNEAVAAALASFLLTIAGGNVGLASTCVDLTLTDLRQRMLKRLSSARFEATVGRASDTRGNA